MHLGASERVLLAYRKVMTFYGEASGSRVLGFCLGRQQSSPVTVVGRHFSSNSNTALSRVYCTCAQLVDAMAVFCFVFSPRMCSEAVLLMIISLSHQCDAVRGKMRAFELI